MERIACTCNAQAYYWDLFLRKKGAYMGKPKFRLMLTENIHYLVSHRRPLVQLEEPFAVLASISTRTILYKWLNSEGLEEYLDSSLCKRKSRKEESLHLQQEHSIFRKCYVRQACRKCMIWRDINRFGLGRNQGISRCIFYRMGPYLDLDLTWTLSVGSRSGI